MTIVQLLPSLQDGGVERGTLEVAQALVERGHRSMVVSAGGRMVEQLHAEGSEHVNWSIGKKSLLTLRFIWKLRRLFRKRRVDVVHARSRLPAWIAWFALQGIPKKNRPHFVTTVHGLYSVGRYSAVMTKGERVIAVSETVKRYIKTNYPSVDVNRVRVIPRGVDLEMFPYDFTPSESWLQQWCDDFPQLDGKLVLTLPGRLTRLKGHHDFIDLIRCLKRKAIAVHGLIVGGEDPRRQAYAEELREKVVQRGLQEDVTFTGHRSDVREIYAISDAVFSLSTKPESFGRTTLEALSLGVPVFGYDHGGVGEILGRVYPQGRVVVGGVDDLCRLLANLRDGSLKRPSRHNYTLAHMLALTLALYEELAARP
ncbi:glycosyl transferase [Solemya pervernicosa gill symbiont]|uniref:Glycosyl transferase n=2 Tax=Gammaproteobacteria incertae sedis TaxID=118884 RepID=A0A1T2L930_9GAMM|nr:glycosyl transferase [Solemya pervernicosa gill symbiont]QKQ28349.1 glycosyltransferase family 4 protein [Candidatus Reidiella endopervernicosa]